MTWWVVVSLGAYALGCWLWPSDWRWFKALASGLGTVLALLTSAHLLADHFTGQGIDESVLYHLSVGLEGAGFAEYLGPMGLAAVLLVLSALFGGAMWWLLGRPFFLSPWRGLATLPLLLYAWGINPGGQSLLAFGHHYILPSPGVELPEEYVQPAGLALADGVSQPRNLVLIYAESLERTYFDERVFPGLVPSLSRRQDEALNFTQVDQMPGMGWTVAGMVGSQCGVPLGRSPGWTGQGGEAAFLPLATCLGDLLADAGYTLHYMGGAESDFAGKGSFHRSHGFSRVEGLQELQPRLDDPDYTNAWGLYDDALLPMVAERFDALAAADAPFVLTTLTLDTHHPSGHLSASCETSRYEGDDDPMLQAVHCSDRQLDELIAHIQASPHAEDTLIAVVSDHTAMRNSVSEVLEQHPRRNLFMVLGDDIAPGESHRPGSQMDVAATLLPLLGFDAQAVGLGRDLLGEEPTFHERNEGSHAAVRALYPQLGSLWAYPDLSRGLEVDTAHQQLIIGERPIDYPALLQVAEDGERVVGVFQRDDFLGALASLPDATGVIWVDACMRNTLSHPDPSAFCLAARAPGEASAYLWPLEGATSFSTAELWSSDEPRPLPALETLIAGLRAGGRVDGWHGQGVRYWQPVPNQGMQFVRWSGVSGPAQFEPIMGFRTAAPTAEFDMAVSAESPVATFRSAWLGMARIGEGVLEERLSPGDTPYSVARAAGWEASLGEVDLRAFGGFRVGEPRAFIRHAGETVLEVTRGIGLVVLSPEGEVTHAADYDTHASTRASDALAKTLATLPEGHHVLLASADEFTAAAGSRLPEALALLGFTLRFPDRR